MQHDILSHRQSVQHSFILNAHSVCLKPTTITRWLIEPSLRSGEIKSDTILPSRATFQKIIRNLQNQQQLVRNLNILQQSAQRVEPPVRQRGRPATISPVWIIICGLFHNMGGIGCCLLRNVYVAPQSSEETLIWCETELINWFVLVKAAGIIRPERPYQIQDTVEWHFSTPNNTKVLCTISHMFNFDFKPHFCVEKCKRIRNSAVWHNIRNVYIHGYFWIEAKL